MEQVMTFMNTDFPQTLVEAVRYFADKQVAFDFMVNLRWPDGIKCPCCGSADVSFIATRKIWTCKHCKKKSQFSVRVGTIFEDSALPLDKWLAAIWMIANAKNGVSSYEVHRAIGVTQKTAWFMLQRIRLAMQTGTFEKFSGEVEVDETWVGGLARNMHKGRNRKRGRGTGGVGKAIVMGILERGGRIKAKHIPNVKMRTLQDEIYEQVEKGAQIFTDCCFGYNGLNRDFIHKIVDHAKEYVRGNIHTNGLENFWSLFKRCVKGTYVSVEPAHLKRYVDEEVFRFNNREENDQTRFLKAARSIFGKRLTYSQLIGEPQPA